MGWAGGAQLKKLRTLIKGGLGAVERMEDTAPAAAAGRREALAAAWAAAFAGLWPLLEAAMGRYGGEEDVMEDLCLVVGPVGRAGGGDGIGEGLDGDGEGRDGMGVGKGGGRGRGRGRGGVKTGEDERAG